MKTPKVLRRQTKKPWQKYVFTVEYKTRDEIENQPKITRNPTPVGEA